MTMNSDYRTTTFKMDSGERYCLIVESPSCLPLFYPNLFLTTQVRNTKSNSYSSISSAANNLIVLLRFLNSRYIDLEQRITDRTFLEVHELDDLRDFTQTNFLSSPAEKPSQYILSSVGVYETKGYVQSATQYMRLTTIAEYLTWLANHLIQRPSTLESNQIQKVENQIKSRRPSRKGRNKEVDHSLDDIQIEALFEAIRIGSEHNPFSSEVQQRNRLMILLLYHLGLRGGELLNIKIEDIDFSKNLLKVVRRADEIDDPRVYEPNAKTLERKIPLSDTLTKELHEYVLRNRRKVQNANRNSFLFVTHKSGPTQGHPISKSGYQKVVSVVKAVSPQLYSLTGHKLRHTWNRKFSELMDAKDNPPSEARQEQIRSYLMGWKPGSGSAAHYNTRFNQDQAHKAGLTLQETSGTRLPKGLRIEK